MEVNSSNTILTVRNNAIVPQTRHLWTNSNKETIQLANLINQNVGTLENLDETTMQKISSQLDSALPENSPQTVSKNPIAKLINSICNFVFQKSGFILDTHQISTILDAKLLHKRFMKKLEQTELDGESDLAKFTFEKAGFAKHSPFKDTTWSIEKFLHTRLSWIQENVPSATLSWERSKQGMGCVVKLTCAKQDEQKLLDFLTTNSAQRIKPEKLIPTEENNHVSYTLGQTDTGLFLGKTRWGTDRGPRFLNAAESFLISKKWTESPFGKTTFTKQPTKRGDVVRDLQEKFQSLNIPLPKTMTIDAGNLICTFASAENGDKFVEALRDKTSGCIALPFSDNRGGDDILKKNRWSEDGTKITMRKSYTELLIYGEYIT